MTNTKSITVNEIREKNGRATLFESRHHYCIVTADRWAQIKGEVKIGQQVICEEMAIKAKVRDEDGNVLQDANGEDRTVETTNWYLVDHKRTAKQFVTDELDRDITYQVGLKKSAIAKQYNVDLAAALAN